MIEADAELAAALLGRLDELRQADRRVTCALVVSVIGHIVGTPLNVIAGRAGLLRSSASPADVAANVRLIEEQVERLSARVRQLVDYFGLPRLEPELRPVGELLHDCAALYEPVARSRGVRLQLEEGDEGKVKVDADAVPLVLTTLLSLAIRTTPPGEVTRLTLADHAPWVLAFELQLPGVQAPPSHLERLEPPEPHVHYDAGTLETLWLCSSLARRVGGQLIIQAADQGPGTTIRFECVHH